MIKSLTVAAATVSLLITSGAFAEPCSGDADCAPYETCASGDNLDCPESGPPPCAEGESDSDCIARQAAWKEENCSETAGLTCRARWLQPCDTAGDCGDGFSCDSGQCQPSESDIECATDVDCPQHWTCISQNVGSSNVDEGVGGQAGSEDVVWVCIPPGSTSTGGSPSQSEGTGNTQSADGSTRDQSAGGSGACSIAAPTSIPQAPLLLSALAAIVGLVSRRIRRCPSSREGVRSSQ
jgi:hypothetical protein